MPPDTSPSKGFRVLVIVSRPLDLSDLPNIADQWALLDGLRRVNAPAYLKILRPPTVEDLRSEILAGYDIVHFDGHGDFGARCDNCGWLSSPEEEKCDRCQAVLEDREAKGYLFFEREDGRLDSLAADELADIISSDPESPTKLIILSACESAKGGEASLMRILLDKGVPAVLGMNESIPVNATIALSAPFYAGLGAGMTIDRAFKAALPALKRLENGSDLQKIPVLDGAGKEARILSSKAVGKASFDAERLFGVPGYEFVGDYIRGDPSGGRKGYLSQIIDALLDGEKLVVLTGQGGIGKTVLAAEAARRLAWRYPGGVFWWSSANLENPCLNDLLDAFEKIMEIEFRALDVNLKRARILDRMRDFSTASLMVVDNAEKVYDDALWIFLDSVPQPSAALATIREGMTITAKEIHLREMEEDESLRLFVVEAARKSIIWKRYLVRMREEKLSSILPKNDYDSLMEILKHIRGHPLLLRVAASEVSSRSLSSLLQSLKDHPPKDVTDRFDFSYFALETESQRQLLQMMASFASSVTEDAVIAVCTESGDNSRCSDDLRALTRKSLVEYLEDSKRYYLHPLMRQYAAAKAGDAMAISRAKAAQYFLGYAERYQNNFDMLELERENIMAAMDWAVVLSLSTEGEKKKAVCNLILAAMSILNDYFDIRGYWTEHKLRVDQAIKAAEALGNNEDKSRWVHNLGILLHRTGDHESARRYYEDSLKIKKELGDKAGVSKSLHQLGTLAQDQGDYESARKYYKDSLKILNELGDKAGLALSSAQLALLEEKVGNIQRALELIIKAEAIFLELKSPYEKQAKMVMERLERIV